MIGMLDTKSSAKVRTAGILNALALALVLCRTETLLIPIGRVFKECHAQTKQYSRSAEENFEGKIQIRRLR